MSRHSPLRFRLRYLRQSRRAQSACERLGLAPIEDFCACDRDQFLSLPNSRERTWRDLPERAA